MSVPLKLGAFAGGLAVAFVAAFSLGAAADPVTGDTDTGGAGPHHDTGSRDMPGHDSPAGPSSPSGAGQLPGLSVSEDGYTLEPVATSLPPGTGVPFAFRVTGPDGEAVTSYIEGHDKELHLVVVRRDLVGYQHVHPVRSPAGTWSVPLDLSSAGSYRVLADFEPAGLGRGVTLGTDVFVAGQFVPAPLPAPAARDTVGGFVVTADGTAEVRAGRETELTFTVTRGGREVRDLQPYLGAFGHLVSLRTGDLAYLHTHPTVEADGDDRGGPQVRFATVFPTAGTYRLFLDFRVAGSVHTAAFTVSAGSGGPGGTPSEHH